MKTRDVPETMENSPEFIKVFFDERGHPINIKNVKNPPTIHPQDNNGNNHDANTKPVVTNTFAAGRGQIEKMIIFANMNIESLRREIKQSNYYFQQALQNVKSNDSNQINGLIFDSIKPVEEKIGNLEKKIVLQDESVKTVNKKLDQLAINLSTLSKNMNEISNIRLIGDKLNLLGISFYDLSKKIDELRSVPGIDDKLKDFNLRISNLVKEISGTKENEIVTAQYIKSFLEEVSTLRQEIKNQGLYETTFIEKIDSLEKALTAIDEDTIQGSMQTQEKIDLLKREINGINENVTQNNIQTQEMVSNVQDRLYEFSPMNEKLDSLKSMVRNSIDELTERRNQLRESLIDQERISRELANESLLKIQKMLKKPKKRVAKPTRAKVIRFLKKNFKIKPFSKVLVVTDKRNTTFGKILYEATRIMSKKSVFVVEENRTNKMGLDKPVAEAIKQSSYTFIVGKYSLLKMKEVSKKLKHKVKIVSMKRTLNYSNL